METKTDWRSNSAMPTVCRCCLADGCYKDISTEYFWMGKREVYAEMLIETFDLNIAYSQAEGPNSNSRLICEPCISRLRDAADFKKQVQECEKTFLQHLDPGRPNILLEVEPPKGVKVEEVKEEKVESSDDDFMMDFGADEDDDDDLDNQPLTKLASKKSIKESVDVRDLLDNTKAAEKRKSIVKIKSIPAKKVKIQTTQKDSPKATPKPTNSKLKADKKKEYENLIAAREKAKLIVKHATAYPFRMPGQGMFCVYCSESFDEPTEYRAHHDQQHAKFNVDTAFAHINSSTKDFIKVDCTELACRICMKPFDDIPSVAEHLYYKHSIKFKLDIQVGMQVFKFGDERWVCVTCSMKFPSLRGLSRHMNRHNLQYTCETCGRNYNKQETLTRHLIFGHNKHKICSKCRKTFPNNEERRKHVLESKRCWVYCCDKCPERFVSNTVKKEHLREVHGVTDKPIQCPECFKVFDRWKKYRSHFVIAHTNENFECSICGLKFEDKRGLKDHFVTHTSEKPYPCNVCLKAFSRKKSLTQHMWIHSEKKRFECKPCNKKFNQRVSWKTHMKSYHPELVDF